MQDIVYYLLLISLLSPLVGALLAGLCGELLGRKMSHSITITGVLVSLLISLYLLQQYVSGVIGTTNMNLYTWAVAGGTPLHIGVLMDSLTLAMMVVVTFVSLMVHVYTIGYMADDPAYQRFFSYISLFTFAMLVLVVSNNFLQLFFGWEAVGVVSYLLIGFWFKRPTAIAANLKAFLVNRLGDFGFLLGIAAVYAYFGTLDYDGVFEQIKPFLAANHMMTFYPGYTYSAITVICITLFIGAMGKSAQVPLHVWLPDSMEGPTPISALIHAATMVTAGVFMVARLSPLFEHSASARNFILTIGAITALFMGLLGLVMNDIKRVIAYSTLSQLGYMVAALGASAYSIAIFHLVTHAFFKALLFLGAGSVIIGMHHQQDMRKMGNIRRYMPITYITCLIGSIALAGIPPLSGFYSKDLIIEAVHASQLPSAHFAYFAVLSSVFVTALYTFRLIFLVFHTEERMSKQEKQHLKESPAVVWLPLVALAIPSALVGYFCAAPLIFDKQPFFADSLVVLAAHDPVPLISHHFKGPFAFALHAVETIPFWLALAGIATAYICYVSHRHIPATLSRYMQLVHQILLNKYGFDQFNQWFFANGTQKLGQFLWRIGDTWLIDGLLVNGSARLVGACSRVLRTLQSGFLYHYALAMILGLLVLVVCLRFY